ncbi:WD40/YVTN/BNR-like repeat-containing protein, partial [Candidatus Omnitrophota bacterium]
MAKGIKIKRSKKEKQFTKRNLCKLRHLIAKIIGGLALIAFSAPALANGNLVWQRSDKGISETEVMAIFVAKDRTGLAFAGTRKGIYKSIDSGASWRLALMLKGERKGIYDIAYDYSEKSTIYAATGDGLYSSKDEGESWKNIFKGKDINKRKVNMVTIDSRDHDILYTSTQKGLFKSSDGGSSWSAIRHFLNKDIIATITLDLGIYVCTRDNLYFSRNGSSSWERIFTDRLSRDQEIDIDSQA